jgi:hypothetical protein
MMTITPFVLAVATIVVAIDLLLDSDDELDQEKTMNDKVKRRVV